MLYGSIVKKRIRQAFDDVNNRRWDELMTSITPRVHHRFGGVHAIGGERHDREPCACGSSAWRASCPISISRSTTSG